jgi:hypothetical protein
LLKNLAIDSKEVEKSSIDIIGVKSKQKKWQEIKLQKLSVEKLKEKGLVWVPK